MIAVNNESIKKPLMISGFFIEKFGGMVALLKIRKSSCKSVVL